MWNYFNTLPDNLKYMIVAFVSIIILLLVSRLIWGEQLKKFSVSITTQGLNFNLETHINNNVLCTYDLSSNIEPAPAPNQNNDIGLKKKNLSKKQRRILNLLMRLNRDILIDGDRFGKLRNPYIGIPKPQNIKLISKSSDIPLDFLVTFADTDIIDYWEKEKGERNTIRRQLSPKITRMLLVVEHRPLFWFTRNRWAKSLSERMGLISKWVGDNTLIWVIVFGFSSTLSEYNKNKPKMPKELVLLIGQFKKHGILVSTEVDITNIENSATWHEKREKEKQKEKHLEKTVKEISK
jgi:hypothetical protein